MRKHGIIAFIIFFVWAPIKPVSDAQEIKMPTPKEGEHWEFKAATKEALSSSTDNPDGNYEVVYEKGQLEVLSVVDGRKSNAGSLAAEELKRMIAFGQDDRQYLKFPLVIGNKWSAKYLHQSPGLRPAWRSIDFNVIGVEEINVAAGIFRVYKIEGNNTVSAGPGGRIYQQKRIIYYSPDTKCIVKFYYDAAVGDKGAKIEIELTKFSFAK